VSLKKLFGRSSRKAPPLQVEEATSPQVSKEATTENGFSHKEISPLSSPVGDTSQVTNQAMIIAIASQKGGSTKTTTTINLGAALAEYGKSVLLVDMDPQGHLAEGFGIEADSLDRDMSLVLSDKVSLLETIQNVRPKLDLAPTNIRLSQQEITLFFSFRREDRLRSVLRPMKGHYDIILIDCPPSLGLLTVNALSSAHQVLIPMPCEFYAMLGVRILLDTVDNIRAKSDQGLGVLGILFTRYTGTKYAQEVVERVKAELAGNIRIFEPMVNEEESFKEASGAGKTILEYAPDTEGAEAYRCLAKEVISESERENT